ncbi:hypothetical protein CONCODRAFT_76673 [Conidiobolus coronatus NRRL 28638]|uniref:Zn(2)-C6 fungal-type domain-containing protein n=1 Tax=Conidiobolus coronatus (strain ATCC 28846 / CBS 209.66 / NRRL 28638) TaxID=796925 RepID=A0A137PIF3_CONC2|nr:hypothetical protein CONCODRAFT_76673 [Conidiobolus coronatus NRRL 28638]|eukprot:KXN74788.1 hypothetical protein CONCODRAFT_76673 [Conidiobolus coronatus NRRL 28638]
MSLSPPPSSDSPQAQMKPAKPIVLMACNSCRQRKVKCDREKPFCKRCVHSGICCKYTPIRTKSKSKTKALKFPNKSPKSGSEGQQSWSSNFSESCSDSSNLLSLSTVHPNLPVFNWTETVDETTEETVRTIDENTQMVLVGNYMQFMTQINTIVHKSSLPFFMKEFPCVLYSILALGANYICRQPNPDNLPMRITMDQVMEIADKAMELLQQETRKDHPALGVAYYNLAFLYLVENQFELGWLNTGLGCQLAQRIGLNRILDCPREHIPGDDPNALDYEIMVRSWWGIYIQDISLGLIYDRPCYFQDFDFPFLTPIEFDQQCPINYYLDFHQDHLSNNFQSCTRRVCQHSKLELHALKLPPNQVAIEYYLSVLQSKLKLFNQRIKNPNYFSIENSHWHTEYHLLLIKCQEWINYITQQFPVNQYLQMNLIPANIPLDSVILAMTLNMMVNDIIILIEYNDLPFPSIIAQKFSQKGLQAAIHSSKIYQWLMCYADVTLAPGTYFSLWNCVSVFYQCTLPPVAPEFIQIAKDELVLLYKSFTYFPTHWTEMKAFFQQKIDLVMKEVYNY